ncbi:MAG: PriCT-2 domain-containing protein [Rhodoferax sp.]|nr:PriCT-2 domain-containing protein [Rhodoferax sp.]
MLTDTDRAIDALRAIPPDLDRDSWVRAGMAAQAAGLDFDAFEQWSAQAPSYQANDCRDTWRSFKPGKGVGAGTLFKMAAELGGWRMNGDKPLNKSPSSVPRRPPEPPRRPAPGMGVSEVYNRCEPATNQHPYIAAKRAAGVPLDALRVVPAGDTLTIQGERMAGALVVPVTRRMARYRACNSLRRLMLPTDCKPRAKPGS